MKKTYQKPVIELEDMDLQEVMTTSQIPFGDSVDDATGAESRGSRFSTWEETSKEE